MANLTPVVRPSVFPDIRPKVSLTDFPPPSQGQEDEDKGRTILTGSDGQVIDLSMNVSFSTTRSPRREEKRQYDIVRIYKVVPNQSGGSSGQIDKNTYVDVEMPHKIQLQRGGSKGPKYTDTYRKPKAEDYPNGNVEIREEDLIRENPRE